MTPKKLYRVVAISQAITWTLLFAGLIIRATTGFAPVVTIDAPPPPNRTPRAWRSSSDLGTSGHVCLVRRGSGCLGGVVVEAVEECYGCPNKASST